MLIVNIDKVYYLHLKMAQRKFYDLRKKLKFKNENSVDIGTSHTILVTVGTMSFHHNDNLFQYMYNTLNFNTFLSDMPYLTSEFICPFDLLSC